MYYATTAKLAFQGNQLMMKTLTRIKNKLFIDPITKRYIELNKNRYPQNFPVDFGSVVLVDLYDDYLSTHLYAKVINLLAKKHRARIEAFYFPRTSLGKLGGNFRRRLYSVYKSFGVKGMLSYDGSKAYIPAARAYAKQTVAALKTKDDVVEIRLEGIKIGDLIYQSYLRNQRETLNLDECKHDLELLLIDAYCIFKNSEDYFKKNSVRAVLISHTMFIHYGIMLRFASSRNIPAYRIVNLGWRKSEGTALMRVDPTHNFSAWPYWTYKTEFAKLPSAAQEQARKEGESYLSAWLSGESTKIGGMSILKGKNSWTKPVKPTPVFEKNSKTKCLILMNSFYDGPHYFRAMLFPDLWEWMMFTLTEASKTDFDWYFKPHPMSIQKNFEVNEQIKKMFPKVRFIPKDTSNYQIVDEGVNAIFSVFGSSLHEYPHFDVPAVSAGESFPLNYDFYIKPKSREEYVWMIHNADKLKVENKEQMGEFAYMHYSYFLRKNRERARPFPDTIEDFFMNDCGASAVTPKILDFIMKHESEERNKKLDCYLEEFFSEN